MTVPADGVRPPASPPETRRSIASPELRRVNPASPARERHAAGPGWAFGHLAVQFICQIMLIVPGLAPVRLFARSAAFGSGLLFLLLIPGHALTRHLGRTLAGVLVLIVSLSLLHPDGAGMPVRFAHWALHIAILAPLFWVARLRVSEKALQGIFIMAWAMATANAITGVLQALYPGRFLPDRQFGVLVIQLSSGDWIPRPPGLTDSAGGAAGGGFEAVLFGIAVAVMRPFPFARLAAALATVSGLTCIYLCQVRALVVMLAICVTVVLALFMLAGQVSRSVALVVVAGVLVVAAFTVALMLGGDTVTRRMATLVAASPASVYYSARGHYLEQTLAMIPEYPLGAGLGRWGMVSNHFGGGGNLWAEIQWTGWLYDGGLGFLIVYPLTVLVMTFQAARLALRHSSRTLGVWAAIVTGYDVGSLALTFSYQVFTSGGGVQFWLINALLLQASLTSDPEQSAS